MASSSQEFVQFIMTNADLRKKIEAAKNSDELLSLAREAGFELTDLQVEQIMKVAADSLNHQLTEDELTGVAGGSGVRIPSYSLLYNDYNTESNKIDPGLQGPLSPG